jgi:hypothetical protein
MYHPFISAKYLCKVLFQQAQHETASKDNPEKTTCSDGGTTDLASAHIIPNA